MEVCQTIWNNSAWWCQGVVIAVKSSNKVEIKCYQKCLQQGNSKITDKWNEAIVEG